MGILDFIFGKNKLNDSKKNQNVAIGNNKQSSITKNSADVLKKANSRSYEQLAVASFAFESNQHQRYENGKLVQGLQDCPRTIKLEKNVNGCSGYQLEPGDGYIVRMINGDTGRDQMAAKPMRVIKSTLSEVVLRGYKVNAMTPFGFQEVDMADYGLSVDLDNGTIIKCTLHMYDRNVDIEYRKVAVTKNKMNIDVLSYVGQSQIVEISAQLNFAHNMQNSLLASRLCTELYDEVGPKKQGGRSLINLANSDCQCVGLAFTSMALCYDFGDEDINSVAAENAFYCLTKNLVENDNTFVAPAIFTILQIRPQLLKDKLISSWCDLAQKQVGIPIGLMLGGNPFLDPRLNDFRQQAFNYKDDIMYYLLSKFFDIEKMEFTVPEDLCYFIPNKSIIIPFLDKMKDNPSYFKKSFMNNCKEHLISVFKQCEDTLMQY